MKMLFDSLNFLKKKAFRPIDEKPETERQKNRDSSFFFLFLLNFFCNPTKNEFPVAFDFIEDKTIARCTALIFLALS